MVSGRYLFVTLTIAIAIALIIVLSMAGASAMTVGHGHPHLLREGQVPGGILRLQGDGVNAAFARTVAFRTEVQRMVIQNLPVG